MMLMNVSIFAGLPVSSNTKCSVDVSIDLGPEDLGEPQRFDALFAFPRDLDQGEFALERSTFEREIAHAMHGTSRSS